MNVEDFDFDLPEELIAQTPLLDRTASRLLVLNKETGQTEDKVRRQRQSKRTCLGRFEGVVSREMNIEEENATRIRAVFLSKETR